jgi:hypothetical protein
VLPALATAGVVTSAAVIDDLRHQLDGEGVSAYVALDFLGTFVAAAHALE